MLNDKPMTVRDAMKITDFESDLPAYTEWKREKIEAALRKADEQPDDVLTQREIWQKFGLGD